jgi:hypothetical protein
MKRIKKNGKIEKWVVMVYLAGDTKDVLSAEMIFALNEMREAKDNANVSLIGPEKRITVLALFDPCAKGFPTERYVINKKKTLQDSKEALGDRLSVKESLADFVEWGIREYQADRYMLILSGHGSGPEGDCLLPDQDPPNALTLSQLNEVLKKTKTLLGRPLDILAMSCCLASMVEICHSLGEYKGKSEFENYVNYLIGPEGFEPLTGWPYREVFASMTARIENHGTPADISKDILKQYNHYYQPYVAANISTGLSILDPAKYGPLAESLAEFGFNLGQDLAKKTTEVSNAMQLARIKAQSYLNFKYVDLIHFCSILMSMNVLSPETMRICERVKNRASEMIIDCAISGKKFEHSNGLAIYLPWTEVHDRYRDLSFARDIRWHQCLDQDFRTRSGEPGIAPFMPAEAATTGVRGGGDTKPETCLLAIPG